MIFSGGLGDTLLYVPLLKELKKKQFHITTLFFSADENDCLFDRNLYDRKVHIRSKAGLLCYAIKNTLHFANFYVNHLAGGRLTALAARICSARTTRCGEPQSDHTRRIRSVPVVSSLTYAEQNLNLLFTAANARIKDIRNFQFEDPELNAGLINALPISVSTPYFIVQVSSGNNRTPFKNWPITSWIALLQRATADFKDLHFLVIGDATEIVYLEQLSRLQSANCNILIGKTSVSQVFNLLAGSNGYIGLDSGIMHMAVALKKRTVSIFGASNDKLLAYNLLDPDGHAVITAPIYCRPCSSWKNANTSRVTNPLLCPDYACLNNISVETVYQTITDHFGLSR